MTDYQDLASGKRRTRAAQLVNLFSIRPDHALVRAYDTLEEVANHSLFMLRADQVARRTEQGRYVHVPDLDNVIAAAVRSGFVEVRWDYHEPETPAGHALPRCASPIRLTVHGVLALEDLSRFLHI